MIEKQKYSLSFFLFTLFLILVFNGLGTWQLKRKTEKEALLLSLAQAWVGEIYNLDKVQVPTPLKPLYALGQYMPGKTIFLQAKTHKGKSGVYILDIFHTQEGRYLLVQRGWSPKEHTPPPAGKIKIEGIVRTPSPPTYFQPLNKPPVYFWIDLDRLSQELHLPLLPFYLVAKNTHDPHIYPTDPFPLPRNHHLEYAITWYSLAFVLLIMLLWMIINRFWRTHDSTNHHA
ncbi:MAG: SURF1 family protein [Alphaproteobacteria bacterium]|nr:SURF1 family protein [Alphaproteobacteria bacterium]